MDPAMPLAQTRTIAVCDLSYEIATLYQNNRVMLILGRHLDLARCHFAEIKPDRSQEVGPCVLNSYADQALTPAVSTKIFARPL